MKSTTLIVISTSILEPTLLMMVMLIFSVVVSLIVVSYEFYKGVIKNAACAGKNKYPKTRPGQCKS
jgi:hypothetical protein